MRWGELTVGDVASIHRTRFERIDDHLEASTYDGRPMVRVRYLDDTPSGSALAGDEGLIPADDEIREDLAQ